MCDLHPHQEGAVTEELGPTNQIRYHPVQRNDRRNSGDITESNDEGGLRSNVEGILKGMEYPWLTNQNLKVAIANY